MIKYILTILALLLCFSLYNTTCQPKYDDYNNFTKLQSKPLLPCQQLYYSIKKYAKQYNIPLEYVYGIAYQETRWQGPNHLNYSPNKISSCNARGALQILPNTANRIMKRKVNIDSLINNIDLNVLIAMRLLRRCKDKFGTWGKSFSYYNSGKTKINQYALNIINKKYKWK